MMRMKQLIFNAWVLTFDNGWKEYPHGWVYIEDDKIVDVGDEPAQAEAYRKQAEESFDAKGRWLLPGMVNAHTHLFQTFLRGLADDKPLKKWLFEEVYPFSAIMEEEDFHLSALVGCIENLKNGATSVFDQHYVHSSKKNADQVLAAMEKTGIRGAYCRTFSNRLPNNKPLEETKEEIFREMDRLRTTWHGKDNGRLTLALGALNPWGSTADLISDTYAYAEEHDLQYQIHTAETEHVVKGTLEEYGLRNVSFFKSIDAIGPRASLAHAVYVDEEEIAIIKESGAKVVHNPVANMYLASGVAPVPRFLELGITVAVATDGPGSNNSQDMIEVLKTTPCLHKVHTKNAMIMYPEDVLRMATKGGAAVLGRDDLGVIRKGYKADLILMNWKKSHIAPVHKANSGLVYNANGNDVDCVWVDGKMVVNEKSVLGIDEVALLEICQERAIYLRKKVRGLIK